MAKTLEQIQQEFNAISLETRNAYDRLQKVKSFDKTTDTYKQAEDAYKKAQEKKNLLRKELEKAKKTSEAKGNQKSFSSAYQKSLTDLREAELAIEGYQGAERYQEAYRKVQKAYQEAVDSGVNLLPIPAPKIEIAPVVDPNKTGQNTAVDTEQFNKDLINSGQYIAGLSEPGRKNLAEQLNKVYGLKLPINGKYSAELKNAYQKALGDNLQRSIDFNRTIPFAEFLVISDKEGTYKPAGGTGEGKPNAQLSNPTQAAATINGLIKSLFNREATPKEIANLTKKLNEAERKNPFKTVNGITTGGLNDQQFLLDILKATPEYAKRKAEGSNIDAQTIRGTARANLLELSDVQVNNFLKDLEGGQDINTINNRIRSIAAMGMPDSIKKMVADGADLETIYQPYKTRMASILELNPEAININDTTLRSAIGPDKEMPLYEFEKALRKDSRWQYTNSARTKASEISARIRRDFGFEA
jgi:hypothetical protein